eukprot:1159123-Pelagomonas_calceolata.AAC.7
MGHCVVRHGLLVVETWVPVGAHLCTGACSQAEKVTQAFREEKILMLWRTALSRFTGAPRLSGLCVSTIASYKAAGGNNKGKDGAITSAIQCSLNAATAAHHMYKYQMSN